MTEIEKVGRRCILWVLLATAFFFMALGMSIQCMIDDSNAGAGGIPAIASLICLIIAHYYGRIIDGMRLLEDMTWE